LLLPSNSPLQIYDENKEKAGQAKEELLSLVPTLQEVKPIPIQVVLSFQKFSA
jgi:hypothetical protein